MAVQRARRAAAADTLETVGLATTDVACGGAGNRTLSITESESGSTLCTGLAVPGRPMYSHT